MKLTIEIDLPEAMRQFGIPAPEFALAEFLRQMADDASDGVFTAPDFRDTPESWNSITVSP